MSSQLCFLLFLQPLPVLVPLDIVLEELYLPVEAEHLGVNLLRSLLLLSVAHSANYKYEGKYVMHSFLSHLLSSHIPSYFSSSSAVSLILDLRVVTMLPAAPDILKTARGEFEN